MVSFFIEKKKVTVFPGAVSDRPIIYLNTFGEEGETVLQKIGKPDSLDFSLAAVSHLEWNHDMVPWQAEDFTGGADDYLKLFTEKIMPEAEKKIKGTPPWRGIAGYSLAGLFALYALYQTSLFSRAASISGSLWFPGFKEYIATHEMKRKPDGIYFSLGEKEHKTRNPLMKGVRQNTEEIERFCRKQGIPTAFQLNPGNHFQDAAERTASGILWMLRR